MPPPRKAAIRTPFIYDAVIAAAARSIRPGSGAIRHLDIGAGRGELIDRISATIPGIESAACDFHVERFTGCAPCVQVQLDQEPLPYADASFDLVTCSEVIEHLENFRRLVREAYRVTAAGGAAIFTTPNVLSASSRLRYAITGFAKLFGPLPLRNERLYSTGGHITPIPFFYLAHALTDAGFDSVTLKVDKYQRTSCIALALLTPFILLGWPAFWLLEKFRYRTIRIANAEFVKAHASLRILLGRTIIVSAARSATAHAAPHDGSDIRRGL